MHPQSCKFIGNKFMTTSLYGTFVLPGIFPASEPILCRQGMSHEPSEAYSESYVQSFGTKKAGQSRILLVMAQGQQHTVSRGSYNGNFSGSSQQQRAGALSVSCRGQRSPHRAQGVIVAGGILFGLPGFPLSP